MSFTETLTTFQRETSEKNRTGYQTLWRLFILVTCIKTLLIPTYHSTDFEVHRNWLAITYNLPVKEWYISVKSQWTLDYPPFFAWFEYFLSYVAVIFDSDMLKIDNFNYASNETIIFQRLSVILADCVFAYGVKELAKVCYKLNDCHYGIFILLSLYNIGLLIVDHIHFQYNGFLYGILLLSVARVVETSKKMSVLQGAAYFAILLNFKHIYLYIAPAYVVWLLKWCAVEDGNFFKRLCSIGIIVVSVFTISFYPFLNQLPQVVSRLFPFKRGLVHAYWAPNGWALYISVDKVLSKVWKSLNWIERAPSAVLTGGLVQEQSLVILPTPSPLVTLILTVLSMLPSLWFSLRKKDLVYEKKYFIQCIVLCGLSSFMFGWHVHEKAILTAIIPLCAIITDVENARIFIILSSAGYTALLPLLYPSNLAPFKIIILVLYLASVIFILSNIFKKSLLYLHEYFYIAGLPFLTVYETILHKLIFGDNLPFLPLAMISIYCALGITYSWLLLYYIFIRDCKSCKKIASDKKSGISSESEKQKTLRDLLDQQLYDYYK